MAAQKAAINDVSLAGLVRRNYKTRVGILPRPLAIGVDPGLSGALVVIDLDDNQIIDVIDMPIFQTKTAARKSGHFNHLDVHKLSFMLEFYAPNVACAFLEEPGAMPDQGLSSTFQFGRVCGQIHGVMAGHNIPVYLAKPGAWKAAMGLSSNKEASRELASLIYKNGPELWPLKKHNDRAEAALLVAYGKKYLSKFIDVCRR